MIVPEYWAEAKERVVVNNKARTFKRFGWSDASERDAEENARQRVSEAADLARRGEKVRLVDHKVAYNGSEGLPIREEIISRRGESVITRNGYGAACLNTPDVLFADVDVEKETHGIYAGVIFVTFLLTAFWLRTTFGGSNLVWAVMVAGVLFSSSLGNLVGRMAAVLRADPFDKALEKIEAFGRDNNFWLLRVYRTPNGFRVLAMHETFDPIGDKAHRFMEAIGGDPLYARMCRNQNCFRARVSPKPWRIGIEGNLRPRPGVWPIAREKMGDRRHWVRLYEAQAANYAACRFVKTIGTGRSASACEDVRRIHDELCKTDSSLPIA